MKLEIYKCTINTYNTIYKYYLISDNRYIAHCTMEDQNSCDSVAVGRLLSFFEDHINDMFDISNRPIIYNPYISYIQPKKLCEMTYTEIEMKQLRVNKKIEEINKDF